MNSNKHIINVLRKINTSPSSLRTNKDFSDSEFQLVKQLLDEDYITGKWEFNYTPPITNIRPTIKSRKYQEELEQKNSILKWLIEHFWVPLIIALVIAFITVFCLRPWQHNIQENKLKQKEVLQS
jgi:hypothetical protein